MQAGFEASDGPLVASTYNTPVLTSLVLNSKIGQASVLARSSTGGMESGQCKGCKLISIDDEIQRE